VRQANALLRTRRRDLPDTLAQLIHDEDQVLSAAAIHHVEAKELWGLADDLEHVLAHRDPRDWLAFESASWALAARRITAEGRRARWREPLPAVESADRLRRVPLLGFVPVDALVGLARAARTVRPEPGQPLGREGTAATEIHFLLEGRVVAGRDGVEPGEREAPLALGLEAVLCGERLAETVRAGASALCLALGVEELLALLGEDADLSRALFRAVLGPGGEVLRPQEGQARPPAEGPAPRTLEIVHLLEASPLFAGATARQLLDLAQIAREEPLAEGATLLGEADPPALYLVERGGVSVEGEGGTPVDAGPGDTVGVRAALAGVRDGRARVTSPGTALRIDATALLALLAGDADLVQGVFGALRHAGGPPLERAPERE
jgi:hypothetical protein